MTCIEGRIKNERKKEERKTKTEKTKMTQDEKGEEDRIDFPFETNLFLAYFSFILRHRPQLDKFHQFVRPFHTLY